MKNNKQKYQIVGSIRKFIRKIIETAKIITIAHITMTAYVIIDNRLKFNTWS